TMPWPLASKAVTAVASSAMADSSVVAGVDAKRIEKFQSGETSSRSSATPPSTAAAVSTTPPANGRTINPAAPKPRKKLNRKRGDISVQKVRLAAARPPAVRECELAEVCAAWP